MEYALHIVVLIALYGSIACSLNLLSGHIGLISLCTAGFYGIGAYTTGLLSLMFGFGWLETFGAGLVISGAAAVLLGLLSLRFRDDYFVIATLAFQVLLWNVMQNWVQLT